MDFELIGVNHNDRFGPEYLRTWAQSRVPRDQLQAIGVEYSSHDAEQIDWARIQFRKDLKIGLPLLPDSILDEMVQIQIPGHEITFATRQDTASIIWLDDGRATNWSSVLHTKSTFWVATLRGIQTVASLDTLSRAVWSVASDQASTLCREPPDAWTTDRRQETFCRDKRWVDKIEKYFQSAPRVDRIVLIVGASHVLPVEGSVRSELEKRGHHCEVTYPTDAEFREKCGISR